MKMKKILVLVIFTLFFNLMLNAQGRVVSNFNEDWTLSNSMIGNDLTVGVTLPHVWDSDATSELFDEKKGTYYYKKDFTVPSSWVNKQVYIRFEGVASLATIFVNGKYVGEHRGAFTSFTFDITSYLISGRTNTIDVAVNNADNYDILPIAGDYNVYGGIFRDVNLIVVDRVHISPVHYSSDGVYITPTQVSSTKANIDATVLLVGPYGDKGSVKLSVLGEGAKVVASATQDVKFGIDAEYQLDIPLQIDNPRLWNAKKDPFTYICRVEVLNIHSEVVDALDVPFGLRTVAVDRAKGFMLNCESYPLYGVTYMQDRSDVKSALVSYNRYEDLSIIEEIGATAVRTANAPHHRELYTMADDMGLVIWVDLPLSGDIAYRRASFVDTESFTLNAKEQLQEIIYQLYNHPSIAFLGIFSNTAGVGASPINLITELNADAKVMQPNVLTAGCSNQDGSINEITDVVSWSQYFGWDSRSVNAISIWLDSFHTGWQHLKPAVGEYGAGASVYHQEKTSTLANRSDSRHPEPSQTTFHQAYSSALKDRSYLWSYFVNSIFDYGSYQSKGGYADGLVDVGLVTYDRHYKKDAFYLYKALWNTTDKFIHITEKRIPRVASTKTDIVAFSNCKSLSLKLNGESVSTVNVVNGVAKWSNITLKEGLNKIDVVSGDLSDTRTIISITKL